jgi:uncharacterized damage-inducible protein DinB
MSEPVLTADEVLQWNEKTSNNWRKFLTANPDVLAIPCDVAGTKNVAELMQHIVAVELRWAERIARLPETTYEQVPYDSIDNLYATHNKAMAILKQALAANFDWNQSIDFVTRTFGPASSTAKTMYFHALLHSIRHYAQLGTLLRQHGYKLNWLGDYLAMDIKGI